MPHRVAHCGSTGSTDACCSHRWYCPHPCQLPSCHAPACCPQFQPTREGFLNFMVESKVGSGSRSRAGRAAPHCHDAGRGSWGRAPLRHAPQCSCCVWPAHTAALWVFALRALCCAMLCLLCRLCTTHSRTSCARRRCPSVSAAAASWAPSWVPRIACRACNLAAGEWRRTHLRSASCPLYHCSLLASLPPTRCCPRRRRHCRRAADQHGAGARRGSDQGHCLHAAAVGPGGAHGSRGRHRPPIRKVGAGAGVPVLCGRGASLRCSVLPVR